MKFSISCTFQDRNFSREVSKRDMDHAHTTQSTELWEAKFVIFSTLLTAVLSQQVAKSSNSVKESLTKLEKSPQDVWELTQVV